MPVISKMDRFALCVFLMGIIVVTCILSGLDLTVISSENTLLNVTHKETLPANPITYVIYNGEEVYILDTENQLEDYDKIKLGQQIIVKTKGYKIIKVL